MKIDSSDIDSIIIFASRAISNSVLISRKSLDRMELMGIDYLTKVRQGYLKIMGLNPVRFKKIDCNNQDIISVNNETVKLIKLHLKKEM